MNKEEMPRERMIHLGPQMLKDEELLAIMIGYGTSKKNVMELSHDLIEEYGLKRLFQMNYAELQSISGIKEAKATKLMACFEIAKRCVNTQNNEKTLKTSEDVYEYLKSDFYLAKNEKILALFVDNKCRVIKKKIINSTSSSMVEFPTREIIGDAILYNAYGIILAHNHPSNDIKPSKEDIVSTRRINSMLNEMNIVLLDHLIIGSDKYYSIVDNDILKY